LSDADCQSPITIRQADAADAEAILACLADAFAPYRSSYTPGAFADTVLDPTSVQDRLREMQVFVAMCNGQVVGTIACRMSGDEGHVRGMAVLPQWHGRRVASTLLAAAEAEIRQQKGTRVTLDTTLPLVRARRFYERHGYVLSGRVSDFFGMPLHEYVKAL